MSESTAKQMGLPTRLEVPSTADYARVVRMTAANLATLANFDLEDVEDMRIAAEEAFIYSLATNPGEDVHISFEVCAGRLAMDILLGDGWNADDPDQPSLAYSALILQALCDVYEIVEEPCLTLHLVKEAGAADAR